MTIYIILASLIILFLIEYYFQRSYMAPFALLLLSFLMATTIIIANIKDWDVHINSKFAPYIFTAIASFAFGCIIVRFFSRSWIPVESVEVPEYQKKIFAGNYPSMFMFMVSLICTVSYLYLMIRNVGFSAGLSAMLSTIYKETVSGSTSNFILHQFYEIVIAVAKINFFQLMVLRYVKKSNKKRGVLYIPIIFFGLCMVISTDRNVFIRFVLYCLCLWMLFFTYTSTRNRQKTNWKILRKTLFYVLILLLVFFGLGKLKNYTSNLSRMIGLYGGSGLYNFNLFLDTFSGNDLEFGNSTFSAFQNVLKRFGLLGGDAIRTATHGEFITYRSSTGYVYASNIYSAMRPYVEDFGYFGLVLYPLILGIIFEALYRLTNKRPFGFSWVFYSLMMYPVVYFIIAEQFFRRFHLGMVYEIGWIAIFYFLIYGRNGLWNKRIVFRL